VDETIDKFIAALADSIARGTFVKLSLANYKGTDEQLQKITVRPVETKKGSRLLFQYRGKTSDKTKNFDAPEAADQVERHLHTGFRSGHLFTTERDHQIIIGKRSAKITEGKPTFRSAEPQSHDREKHYIVDINAPFLKALGITTERNAGTLLASRQDGGGDVIIRADQRDKWKQINKFVEILDGLYESSDLKDKQSLSIADMGSGKGYLTFAAYDHFSRKLSEPPTVAGGLPPAAPNPAHDNDLREREDEVSASSFNPHPLSVTGIESRPHLVDLCNDIAAACGYTGLKFVRGDIADFDAEHVDILIALHACDTATDDALYKGIAAKASVIVAAPCCHKEIKKQLTPPTLLAGILKHAVMLERTAETITDGLRSLLLEREGYRTKMFEFVPTEHTPKNNMLVAIRTAKSDPAKTAEIEEIKNQFGIRHQHLLDRLSKRA
jgi:hypothetical protein